MIPTVTHPLSISIHLFRIHAMHTHTRAYTHARRIVLIGHSKGGLDALAAVAKYKGELAPIVRGIVCLQSPIGGSPVASDLVFGSSAVKMFVSALYRLVGSDFESLRDLTYESRQKVRSCACHTHHASSYMHTYTTQVSISMFMHSRRSIIAHVSCHVWPLLCGTVSVFTHAYIHVSHNKQLACSATAVGMCKLLQYYIHTYTYTHACMHACIQPYPPVVFTCLHAYIHAHASSFSLGGASTGL
jgi:hypothetical protein